MGRGFVKLGDDAYIEWSTVVDAPVSYVMNREQAVKAASEAKFNFESNEYESDLDSGEQRISRADAFGTSFFDYRGTAEDYIAHNRAGRGETELTLQEILDEYRFPMEDEK